MRNMWRSPVSGRRSSTSGDRFGFVEGRPIPDIARKLEIGTEIPQGVLHRPGGHWTPGALGCELQRVRDWADSSGDVDLGL
jgi:hypothetical protein